MAGDLNVKAEIEYVLKDQGITAAVSKVKELETAQKKVTEETKKSAEATGSFAAGLKQVGAYAASFLAAGSIISFLRSSQREFIEAERSTQRLQMALRLLGSEYAGSFEAVSKYADEMERLTGVDADVIRSAQSVLVTIGRLSGETLLRATRAALDLSAALGTDLNNAAMIIAKAGAGAEGALGRMGIKIDDAIPPSERLEAILKALESRVGGVAEEMGNTLPGAIDKATTAWGNFKEAVGEIFTSPGGISYWTKSLQFFTDVLKQMNQNAKDNTDTLRSLFGMSPIDRSAPKPKVYEDQSGYSETVTVKGMSDADLKALDEKRKAAAIKNAQETAEAIREVYRKNAQDEADAERALQEEIAHTYRYAAELDAQASEEKKAKDQELADYRFELEKQLQENLFSLNEDNAEKTLQLRQRQAYEEYLARVAYANGNINDILQANLKLYGDLGIMGKKYGDKIAADDKRTTEEKIANLDAYAGIATEVGSAIFGANKNWAIAETIINTATAIMKAMAMGNYPMAFLAGAMGVTQIAKIKSTNIGGGNVAAIYGRGASGGIGSSSDSAGQTKTSTPMSVTHDHRNMGTTVYISGPVVGGKAGVEELQRLIRAEDRRQRTRLVR